MQIECPSCARSYKVSAEAFAEGGRAVVCTFCQTRWFVEAAETASDPTRPKDAAPHPDAAVDALDAFDAITRAAMPPLAVEPDPSRLHRSTPKPRRRSAHRSVSRTPRFGMIRSAACVMAGLVCLMALIGERIRIVRAVPQTAPFYAAIGLPVNIRGLAFETVKTARSAEDGRTIVAVSGTIRNLTRGQSRVPAIAFDARDAHGTIVATWTEAAPKRTLVGNETIAFATEAPSLPDGSVDVLVHFSSAPDHPPLSPSLKPRS